ncbi:aminofutalosine synthase MqnE [Desulforegula conservatrix]|uniref:aminofutalosine synthase MqnE n=1 Tax=Desulforegula conservatrix TaxID=153026 RepID=UPI0004103AF5|nr:aminofutalosine synthase MqnE [Desulforegula conservatrix]
MALYFSDKRLSDIEKKVVEGIRLSFADAALLYESSDLTGVGQLADMVRRKKHGKKAFFIYNQHLNYSNVCRNRCVFCAYARDDGENGAYTYSLDDVRKRLLEKIDEPIREIHMVGGLNPKLDFDYYIGLLKVIKEVRPDAVIKAFTAVEIDYLSNISGLSINDVIAKLKEAGLSMMPGGGAEVMSERVWKELFPKKIGGKRWLEIIEAVHKAGITTNATMLYGHIETMEERINHLIQLRELQDRTGGFSAFIPLAFHSQNTKLSKLPETNGIDDLKTVAVSRLMLDNFDHIKAYWVMLGEKTAQIALSFGADDLDGTIMEEKITHMAGASSPKGLTRQSLENLIVSAGFTPVERDSFYNAVSEIKGGC